MYDNIDQDEEVEFTEADLKPIEPIGLQDKMPIQTPVKPKGTDNSQNYNPYTNPALDQELSATIGKNKTNRKQINTSQFLLQDRPIEENTEDTTQTGKDSTDRDRIKGE